MTTREDKITYHNVYWHLVSNLSHIHIIKRIYVSVELTDVNGKEHQNGIKETNGSINKQIQTSANNDIIKTHLVLYQLALIQVGESINQITRTMCSIKGRR